MAEIKKIPKFSIIMPVYNVEKYVARALDSAINQSFDDIEIICVDDCGTDKSMDIVREYEVRDERIKIVKNIINSGTYATRNNGVLAAKGEYLLFLDSDDYLHEDCCLKCFEILEQYEKEKGLKQSHNIDFIIFNAFTQKNKDSQLEPRTDVKSTKIISAHEFEKLYLGQYDNFYPIWSKCVKREIYIKAIKFANVVERITVAEDILISSAILGVSEHVALLNDALYYYYYNTSSITKMYEKNQERIENIKLVISYLERLAKEVDAAYSVFIQCLIFDLHRQIVHNETWPVKHLYQEQLEMGWPNFIARFLLHLNKKVFKKRDKVLKKHLEKYMIEHRNVFEK